MEPTIQEDPQEKEILLPYIQVEDPQEAKSREYIANRNLFCDLLGKFEVVNGGTQDDFTIVEGDTMEILTWSCSPYKVEDSYAAAQARIRINPIGDSGKILIRTYDEVLEILGKVRYSYKRN